MMKKITLETGHSKQFDWLQIIPISLLIMTMISCSGEDPTPSEMIIPELEKIPHYDRDHIPIDDTRSYEDLVDVPPELELLYRYLQDPVQVHTEPFDLQLGSSPRWHGSGPVAVSESRIVVLDGRRNELIEYHLDTHETHRIAGMGSGPGDIQYPRDLILYDNRIYVAREDMYISRFDCSNVPCQPEDAFSLDFSPVSVANTGSHIIAFGGTSMQGNEPSREPLRLIDFDDQSTKLFGDSYDSGIHEMIQWQFSMYGNVRYSRSTNQVVMYYGAYPYLYIYDLNTLELVDTYEFPEARLPEYHYFPMERSIRIPSNDHETILEIQELRNGQLLITLLSRRNYDMDDRQEYGTTRDFHFNYYVLDPGTKESFYIGGYERLKGQVQNEIFLTDAGLLIYNRDDGSFEWAGI